MFRLLGILFSFLFLFLPRFDVWAVSEFSTKYLITYEIKPDGLTHVLFDISQTNNLSQIMATDFSLNISQTDISNIKVVDIDTQITPNISKTNNLATISFPFSKKVVGKDNTRKFTIEYDTHDIATKVGSVWEINIPRLEPDTNISDQAIKLVVPANFASPAYIEPKPYHVSENTFVFSSQTLGNQSVSALFGETQYYQLNLSFYLDNHSSKDEVKSIAIPPDTSYQQVLIQSIISKPLNIRSDDDGNWLADYSVPANSDISISLQATVKLNFRPKQSPSPNNNYTSPTDIWDFQQPIFSSSAIESLNSAKAIYEYVTASLKYDYSRLNKTPTRPGASYALANPLQAICTDFTDLFIALSRKHQIPAREIEGFALSSNDKLKPLSLSQDVLHAWPEYYNRETNTWVQIDPTWSNTTNGIDYFNKLDLNHIAFVVHGSSPIYPLPAGAYKSPNTTQKDIYVTVVEPIIFPPSHIDISSAYQKNDQMTLRLDNLSSVAFADDISFKLGKGTEITKKIILPPLSFMDITLPLPRSVSLTKHTVPLIISINGQTQTIPVTVNPYLPTALLLAISGAAISVAFLAWYLHLRRRRQKAPVHW